jgi:hypothetical protein
MPEDLGGKKVGGPELWNSSPFSSHLKVLKHAKCKAAKEKHGYGHDAFCGHRVPDPVVFYHGNKVQTT